MSKVCQICGRGPQTGKSVSHSNIKTNRRFSINLQVKKIDGKRMRVCARCMKKKAS